MTAIFTESEYEIELSAVQGPAGASQSVNYVAQSLTTDQKTQARDNIDALAKSIGSTANLPLITTASGVITVGSFGTSANTFCQGNDTRLAKYFQAASSDGNNLFIGASTGNTSMSPNGGAANLASYNTIVGSLSFQDNTTGEGNCGIGTYVLADNTTGYKNSAIGYAALTFNTTGYYNCALGKGALYNNTTGFSNVAVGTDALFYNTTGDNNVAVGIDALYRVTTGYYNVGVGANSLVQLTSGVQNVGIGYNALYGSTTAQSNVAVGTNAGRTITTGRRNVFIGDEAGNNASQKVDAEDSIAIGTGAYTTSNGQVVLKGTIVNVQAAEGMRVAGNNATYLIGLSGTTKGLRGIASPSGFSLEAVDNTLSASYEPMTVRGSTVNLVGDVYINAALVSIGAADSGGTGFRVLRIPN